MKKVNMNWQNHRIAAISQKYFLHWTEDLDSLECQTQRLLTHESILPFFFLYKVLIFFFIPGRRRGGGGCQECGGDTGTSSGCDSNHPHPHHPHHHHHHHQPQQYSQAQLCLLYLVLVTFLSCAGRYIATYLKLMNKSAAAAEVMVVVTVIWTVPTFITTDIL